MQAPIRAARTPGGHCSIIKIDRELVRIGGWNGTAETCASASSQPAGPRRGDPSGVAARRPHPGRHERLNCGQPPAPVVFRSMPLCRGEVKSTIGAILPESRSNEELFGLTRAHWASLSEGPARRGWGLHSAGRPRGVAGFGPSRPAAAPSAASRVSVLPWEKRRPSAPLPDQSVARFRRRRRRVCAAFSVRSRWRRCQ